jgi:hypothetical protein
MNKLDKIRYETALETRETQLLRRRLKIASQLLSGVLDRENFLFSNSKTKEEHCVKACEWADCLISVNDQVPLA